MKSRDDQYIMHHISLEMSFIRNENSGKDILQLCTIDTVTLKCVFLTKSTVDRAGYSLYTV